MVRLLVLVRRSIISFMKVNLKMISTMGMEDSFIRMEITISEIGLMGSGPVMVSLWINLVGFMKVSGSTVSLWVNE